MIARLLSKLVASDPRNDVQAAAVPIRAGSSSNAGLRLGGHGAAADLYPPHIREQLRSTA